MVSITSWHQILNQKRFLNLTKIKSLSQYIHIRAFLLFQLIIVVQLAGYLPYNCTERQEIDEPRDGIFPFWLWLTRLDAWRVVLRGYDVSTGLLVVGSWCTQGRKARAPNALMF